LFAVFLWIGLEGEESEGIERGEKDEDERIGTKGSIQLAKSQIPLFFSSLFPSYLHQR
jgi:hypothetical protein